LGIIFINIYRLPVQRKIAAFYLDTNNPQTFVNGFVNINTRS
jgi:hypothetical protein